MGSPSGMWTSVSGAMAQSQNLETISNNLANSTTAGYKKDAPAFKEYLTAIEKAPQVINDVPRTIFKDSEFYHTDGREHSFVNVDRIDTDHTQGSFKVTQSPLDLAIDGNGFFTIKTPTGIQFTRAGNFKIDNQGKLVTNDGYPVMAMGESNGEAEPVTAPGLDAENRNPASTNSFVNEGNLQEINLSENLDSGKKIHISTAGEIYFDNEMYRKLAIAEFSNPRNLKKTTATLFRNESKENVVTEAQNSSVKQGFLEMSNVNTVSEIVNLLKANRLFESNMRAIKTYNDMSGKEANEVGKL